MDNTSAKIFLSKDVQDSFKEIQKAFFGIIDDLRASDADHLEHLKTILQDDTLANTFQLFQENRNKSIRKKVLDTMGDEGRKLATKLDDYQINFAQDIEIKATIK